MTRQTLKTTLRDRLTQNTGEVLKQLKAIFRDNPLRLKEVILHLGAYERLIGDHRKGLIAYSELNRGVNRINDALFDLIELISEEEAAAYEAENAIFQRILVVSLNEDRRREMQTFFPAQRYKDLVCKTAAEAPPLEEANHYEFIVFDDMETTDDYFERYLQYLKTGRPYLLYFGKRRAPDLNEQGVLKAYFANSPFSLHARLDEMFTYLKNKRMGGHAS